MQTIQVRSQGCKLAQAWENLLHSHNKICIQVYTLCMAVTLHCNHDVAATNCYAVHCCRVACFSYYIFCSYLVNISYYVQTLRTLSLLLLLQLLLSRTHCCYESTAASVLPPLFTTANCTASLQQCLRWRCSLKSEIVIVARPYYHRHNTALLVKTHSYRTVYRLLFGLNFSFSCCSFSLLWLRRLSTSSFAVVNCLRKAGHKGIYIELAHAPCVVHEPDLTKDRPVLVRYIL